MVCLSCHCITPGPVCGRCRASLRSAPDRLIDGGIRVVAAFDHSATAKTLVHQLKYRGVVHYAEMVAARLEPRLPRVPLVPIPRALSRKLKYGIDPALVIATALARRLQVPVIEALARPLHTPRRAGRDHSRNVRRFRKRLPLRFPVTVVDDVVTTGATARAAVDAIGADLVGTVAAANVVAGTSNVGVTSPEPGVDGVWQAF